MTKESKVNYITIGESILGAVFLISGCFIYLLLRSTNLNIYQWCSAIGLSTFIDVIRTSTQTWCIPHFVRYSLPDGLYCAAYLLIMDAIWKKDSNILKYVILSLVPIITISSELLQYVGIVRGTFDVYDLLCYFVPIFLYIISDKKLCSIFKIW